MQRVESECSKVPTVDLGPLGINNTEEASQQEWDRVTRQLADALSSVGCAYLTGHGVPSDLMEETLASAIEFFEEKEDFKNRWAVKEGYLGFTGMNFDRFSDDNEVRESFHFRPGSYGPAKEAPPFITSVTPLTGLLCALSRRLMKVIALSLNEDRDYFVNMHQEIGTSEGISGFRFNYYPVTTRSPENSIGAGAHRDLSTITLVFSNNREGFQMCESSGQWVDVPFIPGTILVQAGDFLHFYSNKHFISTLHRVVAPSENSPGQHRPRCSLVFFIHADENTPMWPVSDNPDSPAPPNVREELENLINRMRATATKPNST